MQALSRIRALKRTSLHEELVDTLRDILIESDLEDAEKVPERILCEQLGVSRTPMREALKVLAAEGLVTLVPNRGAVMKALTAEVVNDLFPVIGVLEALAGELACSRISDDEINRIERLHKRMAKAFTARKRAEYFHLNQQIHQCIVQASGNSVLIEQYDLLSRRLRRARFAASRTSERWDRAMAEHTDILAALTDRDGAKLSQVLRDHLRDKHQAVIEQMIRE